MRLLRQNVLLLTMFAAIGCGDSTAVSLPARYVLEGVNSQPLPFSLGLTDIFADRYMILSGSLTLYANGIAVLVERRREPDGLDTTREVTYTTEYPYGLGGNLITIDSCAAGANCVDFQGDFNGATIDLTVLGNSCGLCIYNYRHE